MSMKHWTLVFGLTGTLMTASGFAGLAQAATETPAGPQRTTATYEDWLMQCQAKASAPAAAASADTAAVDAAAPAEAAAVVSAEPPVMSCEINQTFTVRETGATLAKLAIGKVEGPTPGIKAVLLTPVGVYLPEGLSLKVDEATDLKGQYTYCNAQACVGEFDLTDDVIQQMRVAKTIGLTFTSGDRKPLSLSVSTRGLGSAFDASLASR